MQYKVWGLVMGSHNEVCDSLYFMGNKSFSFYSICNKPIVSSSWCIAVKAYSRTRQPDNITVNPSPEYAKAEEEIFIFFIYGNAKKVPSFVSEGHI